MPALSRSQQSVGPAMVQQEAVRLALAQRQGELGPPPEKSPAQRNAEPTVWANRRREQPPETYLPSHSQEPPVVGQVLRPGGSPQ